MSGNNQINEFDFDITVAQDGTGDFNCDDRNAWKQIQRALDMLPNGGTVRIKRCPTPNQPYWLYKSVVMKEGQRIVGEGISTILKAADGLNADMITALTTQANR